MTHIDFDSIQESYDVIIVGAGPAGCILGKNISNKYSTLIIDRDNFPREKPCGGILVERTLQFLRNLDIPSKVFSKPERPQFVIDDWDNNLELRLNRDFLNIKRREFDHWLLSLVPNSADLLPSTTLIDYDSIKNIIYVVLRNGDKTKVVKCNYLIGADGGASTIRRKISSVPIRRYLVIQDIVKKSDKINDIYFIYDKEITDFYSWVIPKDEEMLLATSICYENSKEKMNLFKEKFKRKTKINIDKTFIRREAAVGARPRSLKEIEFGKKNVILVGEAAGLISSSSGEGISFALRSGDLLSKAIKTDFDNPLGHYKNLCGPLISEIKERLLKAKTFSNPAKRKEYYHRIKNGEIKNFID